MTDTSDSADCFEVVDGKLQRRKDGKDHPRLLGDAFRRDEHGEIRFDGSTPNRAKGGLLSNVRALVKSGIRFLGASPTDACREAEANESEALRQQSSRTPVYESDKIRASLGLPTSDASTSETASPKDEPINPLFPNAKHDGGVETPRAKSRREARTPVFDAGPAATSATTSPKDTAGDARAKAQAEARCPIWDASGQGVKRSA